MDLGGKATQELKPRPVMMVGQTTKRGCIRLNRNRTGSCRESEGFVVLSEDSGQHNPKLREGILLCLMLLKGEESGDCRNASHSGEDQDITDDCMDAGGRATQEQLPRKLYAKAKQEPGYRFYALYDNVYRADILQHAYRLVRSNKGAPGIDGVSFAAIEAEEGVEQFLAGLSEEVKNRTYQPMPVRRVMIPKPDGSERPLGIPTIRDRVVQMAVKLIMEPIFEADLCDCSYGFRPKRSAQHAVDDVADALHKGYCHGIDADLSKYFDTIPHAKLMAVVAERIADGGIFHLIKQ